MNSISKNAAIVGIGVIFFTLTSLMFKKKI